MAKAQSPAVCAGSILFVNLKDMVPSPSRDELGLDVCYTDHVPEKIENWLVELDPRVVVLKFDPIRSEKDVERLRLHRPLLAILCCHRAGEETHIPGLIAKGLDDFITLPVDSAELIARISVRLSAATLRANESQKSIGPLKINISQRTVTNGREILHLTPIETKIVTMLSNHVGSVVGRDTIKKHCWGDAEITDNALNRKIYEVRRTLRGLSPAINIRTIYGSGFELQVKP